MSVERASEGSAGTDVFAFDVCANVALLRWTDPSFASGRRTSTTLDFGTIFWSGSQHAAKDPPEQLLFTTSTTLDLVLFFILLMMLPIAWVYILTNKNHTTFYVGMTNDLSTRLWEHRTKQNPASFTARYNLSKLIYYEEFDTIDEALEREAVVKGKSRKWKEELISLKNKDWKDLLGELTVKY